MRINITINTELLKKNVTTTHRDFVKKKVKLLFEV